MSFLYRHFDKESNLLYVGVSLNALIRLSQHRDVSHWFKDISRMEIQEFPSREDAFNAEREAIINENPKHNVKRPKNVHEKIDIPKEVLEKYSETSKRSLLHNVVNFHLTYSIEYIADQLGIGKNAVRNLIEKNEIGHLTWPAPRAGNRPIVRITGWQLIEYLEHKENERHN